MTYIVQRKSRFYVVAYDGIDTLTGRERRRWHPAGHSRTDAEAIAANLELELAALDTPAGADPLTVARYLTEQWLPVRRHDLDPSTAHRYGWIIDHYITPPSDASGCSHCEPSTSTGSTPNSSPPAAPADRASPPRPCTTCTSSAAPPSTTPSTPTSSPPTPPTAPEPPSHGAANA